MLVSLPFLAGLLLLQFQLSPVDGKLGHDYGHWLPRTYIGLFHFWQNGFQIPHFTPSLCTGMPYFADPQQMYYSLPQLFSLFVDPYSAVRLTTLLLSAFGYWGMFELLVLRFSATRYLAHWGALLFLLNGFSFEHLLEGHITHHAFYLFPWILLLWIGPARTPLGPYKKAIALSLLILYLFYSGSAHMLVVLAGLLFVSLPLTPLDRRWAKFVTLCLLFLVLGGSGKFLAHLLFSSSFASLPLNLSEGPISTLLIRYFWFLPSKTPDSLPFGPLLFGAWEYVAFLSKFSLLSLAVILACFQKKNTRALWIVLLGLVWLALSLGLLGNHSLPFFKHYHNPLKLLAAFIPLILCATVVVGNALVSTFLRDSLIRYRPLLFLLAQTVVLFEFFTYSSFFTHQKIGLNFSYDESQYKNAKRLHHLPPVTELTRKRAHDLEGLFEGESSLACYEPLYGYFNEAAHLKTHPGPTETSGDFFNLTHPGCFLYPSFYHCKPWDLIPTSAEREFVAFREGRAPSFPLPLWQDLLLKLNFFFLFALTLGFVVLLFMKKD